jgi:hypothetical protein
MQSQSVDGQARKWGLAALAIALVFGAGLRLIWVEDMEYKADEAWTFQQTQESGEARPFPWRGMPSSQGYDNPGLSVWVFMGLGKLLPLDEPTALARAVQILSIIATLALAVFALVAVPRAEREPWLWAVALLALNPLALLFHRKIWPPSILPIFVTFMLVSWWYRARRVGAFAWGLLGACLGQIHMGGFFFAAGFAGWAALFDRQRVAWRAWFLGSCLGALPLIPWFVYLSQAWGQFSLPHRNWIHILEGRFWTRWVLEPLGFGLSYALEQDYTDFLRYPFLAGHPTYLVGLLHVLVIGIGLTLCVRTGRYVWDNRGKWSRPQSATALTQNAALWGFGILQTLSCLPIHRHYMVIAYPLEFLWLARLALLRPTRVSRGLLATLCTVQFFLSAGFLSYIHSHDRIHGDYGVPYRAQQRAPVLASARDSAPSK